MGAYLQQQGVRQTMSSGCNPGGDSLAERWVGIVKIRQLPCWLMSDYRWAAYFHTHGGGGVVDIDKSLPNFGDVVARGRTYKRDEFGLQDSLFECVWGVWE